MNYLLDTNACIALISGKPEAVRTRLLRTLDRGGEAFVSAVAVFELWYGVSKSARPEINAQRVQTFLGGPITSLPFQEEDAKSAGTVRADLESRGKLIGAYDLLIAGQALRHKLTLITSNTREFRRVKDLAWEDWARP